MHYLFDNYAQQDIGFVRGSGSYLYTGKGDAYLDFGCGISVTNLGHVHPYITEKLKAQADTLWHTSNLFPSGPAERLAKRISNATFGGKVLFCNSGAEANEAAIKLARIYNNKRHNGKKPRIITMNNGFHGRTYATMSATAQAKVQAGFEPMAPFFTHVEYGHIEALIKELEKRDVCAVMLELYQGECGVVPAGDEYVRKLCRAAREHGALVIFDEVQTGYGRTGKFFAYQHLGETPDIMTMAKSMANGVPMGGITAVPEIAELFTKGSHGTTFGGNFLACSAAHAVLDILLEEGFLDEVARKGELAQSMLKDAFAGLGVAVRGRGLLIGIQLPFENQEFIRRALDEKLVLIAGGKDVIRFYPPLTVTDSELEEGVERALRAMRKVMGEHK